MAAAAPAASGRRAPRGLRLGWLDAVVVAVLAAATAYLAWRVNAVLIYKWDWTFLPSFLFRWDADTQRWAANLLAQGLLTTVRLTIWSSLLAGLIGLAIGLCRVGNDLFLRMVARTYVELIRNTPPLVFIFIFYFFISSQIVPALGLDRVAQEASPATLAAIEILCGDPRLLPAFVSGVICLAMFEAAYVAEIVRAGIQSIERGQWEAASGLGLSRLDRMRFVILPQAIQRTVPPMASQFISLVKDSSIVSLISIQELTFMASQVVVSTQRVFEVWIAVGAMYFVLCFILSLAFARLERRLRI